MPRLQSTQFTVKHMVTDFDRLVSTRHYRVIGSKSVSTESRDDINMGRNSTTSGNSHQTETQKHSNHGSKLGD